MARRRQIRGGRVNPRGCGGLLLAVLAMAGSGCAPKRIISVSPPVIPEASRPVRQEEPQPTPLAPETVTLGLRAAELARDQLGKPYTWGASGPDRFDCSGLVFFIYGNLGMDLPRVTAEQAEAGVPVTLGSAEPGDLVFFAMKSPRIDHVGILVGNGLFIHAPGRDKVVRVSDLRDGFWRLHLKAIRRLLFTP